jgi:cobalt-zinc-cadmium efflux system membrane fusion protein
VQNPDGLLKPDMFAKIKIGDGAEKSLLVVPSSAIVSEGNDSLVFVEESRGHFRRRQIQAGHETNGMVVIDSGLQPGERIVTRGGLLLNELGKPQG